MIFFGFWRDVKCTHLTNASTFDAEHHHVPRPPRSTTLASLLRIIFIQHVFFEPLPAKANIEAALSGKRENASSFEKSA